MKMTSFVTAIQPALKAWHKFLAFSPVAESLVFHQHTDEFGRPSSVQPLQLQMRVTW